MLDPQDREIYNAKCKRASSVLRTLRGCEQSVATPGAVPIVPELSFRDPRMHDWKLDVMWCLGRVGRVGSTVLVYRLTRQQKSQANSFRTIGRELAMGSSVCETVFMLSLVIFLSELDKRGIPDHYLEVVPEGTGKVRCAVEERGEACPMPSAAA